MGEVYRAYDTRLTRNVAIKIITPTGVDESRLWREARLAARVNHPGVCQVYEVGEYNGGVFIAIRAAIEGNRDDCERFMGDRIRSADTFDPEGLVVSGARLLSRVKHRMSRLISSIVPLHAVSIAFVC